MPRSGLGVFTAPFPDVVEGTTIESTVHNGTVSDFVTDANAARPITAGGTGATTAATARTNLQAERAMQTVTNYDSHVWETGSFWSAAGASGAPEASGTYGGICYILNNDPNYIVVEARNVTTGALYVRAKNTTWSAWMLDGDDRVSVAGDTMTGNLTIFKVGPQLALNRTGGTVDAAAILGQAGGLSRWAIFPGVESEGGSNTGSNFWITRYNDAGATIDVPFNINRATGLTALNSLSTGTLAVAGAATFSSTLTATGVISGGSLQTAGSCNSGSVTTGTLTALTSMSTSGNMTSNSINSGTITATALTANGIDVGGVVAVACTPTEDLLTTGNDGIQLGRTSSYGPTSYFSTYSASIPGPTAIHVGVSGQDGYAMRFYKNGGAVGSIALSALATAFNTSSDARLKDDLKSFDAGNIIDNTNVYDFKWKTTGERAYGVIAQQAIEVYPTAVDHHEADDWWGIDYSKYVPVLLQELKALRARVADLEDRLSAKPS